MVDYEVLNDYLNLFDVCLIPFKKDEVADSCNPMKLWEYLSAGKPVVYSNLVECNGLDGVYEANDENAMIEKINLVLSENSPELIKKRMNIAYENSWGFRAKLFKNELLKFIK
jgi:hypothetical protein